MKPFPRTYWDNNPEDRDYMGDLWAWLQDQPQDAWLLWIRHANWDNAERLFERMVDIPDCDRAIAAWIFWNAEPAHHMERPTGLVSRILANLQKGHYRDSGLFMDPHEICGGALRLAAKLRQAGGRGFARQRSLCGPFQGRKAQIAQTYDAAVEAELAEILRYSNGWLPRSEQEHWERARRNLWTVGALRLPDCPADPQRQFASRNDLDYLEAIFGPADELERARKAASSLGGRTGWKWPWR